MRSNKINYLIVGSFVIVVLVGLVSSIAILSGQTGPTEAYHAYYRNVTGVKFGSQVFYEGYPIGQVRAVTPEDRNARMEFRVDFDVRKGWRIPADSVAEIGTASLLSAVSLNISAGSSTSALSAGDQIVTREAVNIMDVVASVAGDINDITENNIKPLLENLTRSGSVLAHLMENDGQIIVSQVRALIDDLSERAPAVTENIEHFSLNLKSLGNSLSASSGQLEAFLTDANREQLEGIIDNVDKASADLDLLMRNTGSMIATLDNMVAANQGDIMTVTDDLRHSAATIARYVDSINLNLDGAARNMYEFSRAIRKNPGLLLGGTAPTDNAEVAK
jgi:phospholipid/cholesterol/gamma-HCH transport system substrate-binding protein